MVELVVFIIFWMFLVGFLQYFSAITTICGIETRPIKTKKELLLWLIPFYIVVWFSKRAIKYFKELD